ncbi:centrosome-associated protein 350-like isoform X2 [Mytilus californianus]|nr:centrosome-associated protein 350-like isoform X2 [Mytilus californianus]XP_052092557.1 centrosome-associated protein 350-like isoform X2 [Mytilus californianus]XP_052092558.1 centrosome-associated protein 350-like isoform X2 [Mytilus californianus]XP_052092559.1 centrosome-associated protein 350-like isoform X2 [Mytilus californianus]XP_052092560.1 centrosome-associated protein 350-like isoform X2 [Mytilus californianus]XP_052092561.1 centrosome-associated protein 350-like isoform X2 [Myti
MENSNINEFPSGAVVDKYGRSNVMRNRETRKISKKDDENEEFTSASKMEGKRVDFRDKQELREINPDGTYTDLPPGQYNNLTFLRPNSPPNSVQTTLTDSRAIRETEIRFLNEPTSHTPHDQRRVGTENRLTHVDVMVPGASKSSAKHTTHYQGTLSTPQENNNEIKTAETDRLWETASTDSAQSDDGSMKRKFKKSIKDIGEGGLAKIKEKIKRQQEKASPRENKEYAEDYAMGGTDMNSDRLLHNDNDPVQTRSNDYHTEGQDKHPKRKIAAGHPPPSYKGFSETEVKYKHTEVKPLKDGKKKDKKKKILKAQKTPEPLKEEDQERKLTRVIAKANKKDTNKQKKNEIITTSSWRAGQELVMRELGPLKTRRTSQTSQPGDIDRGSHMPDGAYGGAEEPEPQERKTATDMELERARVLSAEARRVLSDLNMDDEERRREESSKRAKSATKRKAPKPSAAEIDKHSQIKQRHYDAEEIRHYIQKKKAERIQKQIEEEKRQKKADELRRKQLEELYTKQKQTASHPKKFRDIKHKSNNETFSHPMALSDLPRHHPFQHERSRQMMTSDSENLAADDEMEMSDGSSTLTGDSMDEGTPLDTPKGQTDDKSKPSQTSQWKASLQKEHEFLMENNNSKTVGGFTFNLDSVFNKFSQAVTNQQSESENRPLSGNSGYIGGSAVLNPPRPSAEGSDRTREQRLQAIKETAKHLQEKIQNEARKLKGEVIEDDGSTNQRWAFNRHGNEEDFVSRYDRMTDAANDYSVFTSNLPGNQRNSTFNDTDDNPVEAAAIRIQAAYRGHTVRQNLNSWKLPSGQTVGGHIRRAGQDEDESSITETSTFSEITLTEDSENSLLSNQRLVGSGLRERDFHAGGHRHQGPTEMVIPRPSTQHRGGKYSWEEPRPDPDNVFNVFARHQRNQDKQRQGYSTEPKKMEEEYRKEQVTSQHTAPKIRSTQNSLPRNRSPGVGARTHSPGFGLRSESLKVSVHHSVKSRNEDTRPKTSVSFKPLPSDSEHDDTFQEVSYSRQFELSKDDRSKPEKASVLSHSKPSQRHSADTDTDTSSIEDFSRIEEPDRRYPHVVPDDDNSTPKASLRYSPDTLESKFYSELNQLESMEESMRQLTGVERTRAVSMAQQETVSLAQMLKARQQTHERDMKLLEIKVQKEKQEAARIEKKMEEAKQRSKEASQNAKDVMMRVRGDGKEAEPSAKYNNNNKLDNSDNIRPKRAVKQNQSSSDYRGPDSARSYSEKTSLKTAPSYSEKTKTSYTSSRSVSSNVKTASDTQKGRDSDSSIISVSGADAKDESKSESILEDISQASGDEYSINFDDTMTEDEIEEKSFKAILPSESHRKRAKKHHLDNMSVTSDEGSVPSTPRISVDDLGSYVLGEDSFNKFTEEMVKQFMKEEEMRAQHQTSLLQLREKALVEKTKAELEWLEQQKQRIRNKGADDSYPQIIKRQRGLKMKLQEQQAEIKRMREANKAASRERQLLLQQREEISRLRQSTKQTKEKLGGRLGRPAEVHTEDEFYVNEDEKDTDNETSQKKDYKSDSEIYTEPKAAGGEKSLDKLKKLHLDERYLTKREQRLRERKKSAKELLDWKKRLDEEEQAVFELEKKALKVWDHGEKGKKKEKEPEKSKTPSKVKETHPPSVTQDDTIISEAISLAKDESITNTPRAVSASESSPEERQRLGRSESESSIIEEVKTEYSMSESTTPVKSRKSKAPDSATIESQYSETFEDATSVQQTKSKKSPRSPLDKLNKRGFQMGALTGRNISSPRSLFSKTRSCSESESEESISHTDLSYAETMSDLSDFEGRVRALNDELRHRKQVADRLKRERKRRKREILKSKEDALKKQIEAYDNQISQLKTELQKEMEHEPVNSVKPQIKQPKVSPTKNLKTPLKQNDEARTSSNSSYDESAQSSPSILDDKESKPISPDQRPTPPKSQIPTKISLDKISEGSESSKSLATVESKKRVTNGEDESIKEELTEQIQEEISEADSFTDRSKTSSALLKIPKSQKSEVKSPREDTDRSPRDYSYQDDFTEEMTSHKQITSARSLPPENVDLKPQPSPRSITENVISEVISEHVYSHADDDESFIKPLDNVHNDNNEYDESDIEPKSPPSTTKTDSRPSSGKSISSFFEESESDRSEIEKKPTRITSPDKSTDESPIQTARPSMIPGGVFDIDQLIGPDQEFDEDEETPLASPRDEEPPSTTEDDERTEDFVDYTVGDRVQVTGPNGTKKCGTLMFKGRVKFATGIWAGVELESPEGRNDGTYDDGQRYFTCRQNHGVMVPANDLSNAPLPKMRTSQESLIRSSMESNLSGDMSVDQDDLNQLIQEVDENVQNFDDDQHKQEQELLADKITDKILVDLVEKERNFISKKNSPPVAPKPQRTKDSVLQNGSENILMNGNANELEKEKFVTKNLKSDNLTNKLVDTLLDDALTKMITTRNKQRNRGGEVTNLIDFDDFPEEQKEIKSEMTPSEELLVVLNKPEPTNVPSDVPPRPGSPLPDPKGSRQNHLKTLQQDITDLLGGEEEYIDDDIIKPDKPPPPYPESEEQRLMKAELQKMVSEDLYYAVPHESEEVRGIVADVVEIYWQSRRCGEPLDNVQIPDNYFSKEDINGDLDSNSRRVFKTLLFDLAGEVIRDIYKDEEEEPPPWQKPKRRQQKHFRGASPPTTMENLTPIVQQAVINTLGLNGSRKADRNKWTVRKRKDHVDNILVEELREEEPRWINYDEDELAVKMQLTDTIFDMLLNDTVQTMNKVYQKKKSNRV